MNQEKLIILLLLLLISCAAIILWYFYYIIPMRNLHKEEIKFMELENKIAHEQKSSYRHKANIDFEIMLLNYGNYLPISCENNMGKDGQYKFWYWNTLLELYVKNKIKNS